MFGGKILPTDAALSYEELKDYEVHVKNSIYIYIYNYSCSIFGSVREGNGALTAHA